jgi:hypothetical protein
MSPLVGAYPVSCMNCEDVTSYTSWWTIAKRGTLVRVNWREDATNILDLHSCCSSSMLLTALGFTYHFDLQIPTSLLSSHIDKSQGTCSEQQHTWSSLWFAITTYLLSSYTHKSQSH